MRSAVRLNRDEIFVLLIAARKADIGNYFLLGGSFGYTRNGRRRAAGTFLVILRMSNIAAFPRQSARVPKLEATTSECRLISRIQPFIYQNSLRVLLWRQYVDKFCEDVLYF